MTESDEYLPMFLAESREHLQELNLAVVRIEEKPDDAATIGEIFRIAHSLKGMSATMGFERIAALTHAMEDLFEVLRSRRGGLDRASIDLILECLDALDAAVGSIEATGAEALEEGALVERLKALVRSEGQPGEQPPDSPPSSAELAAAAGGRPVFHLQAHLEEAAPMPSVRAFMVVAAAADHGEVLASLPAQDRVESFAGGVVEVWLASDHEADVIAAAARAEPDVVDVAIEEVELQKEAGIAALEETAGAYRERKSSATPTVRVDAERLDQLMHLMGELVVHRTRVDSLLGGADAPDLQHAMDDLTRSSQALQAMVMQVRMIPVEAVFLRFPRLVRDLSSKLGKRVELRLVGSDTELDRTVVDELGDPLVHLVRNSLDHGLESEQEREAAGKPAAGTIEIAARHAGGSVLITVSDDGRGVDCQRVARKALQRGIISPEEVDAIDAARAVELLFAPGFSTAEQTSEVSGRGVGLDAVRTTIRELGGEVQMQSTPGAGTSTEIRLPLTLAIVATLLVEAAGQPFVVALDRVEMTMRLEEHAVHSVAGQRLLKLRDEVLPIVSLAAALGYQQGASERYGVAVRCAAGRIVLAVDRLIGQRELVARPLPDGVGAHPSLSGGAVLASGQIALIVDCDAVAKTPHMSAVAAPAKNPHMSAVAAPAKNPHMSAVAAPA